VSAIWLHGRGASGQAGRASRRPAHRRSGGPPNTLSGPADHRVRRTRSPDANGGHRRRQEGAHRAAGQRIGARQRSRPACNRSTRATNPQTPVVAHWADPTGFVAQKSSHVASYCSDSANDHGKQLFAVIQNALTLNVRGCRESLATPARVLLGILAPAAGRSGAGHPGPVAQPAELLAGVGRAGAWRRRGSRKRLAAAGSPSWGRLNIRDVNRKVAEAAVPGRAVPHA